MESTNYVSYNLTLKQTEQESYNPTTIQSTNYISYNLPQKKRTINKNEKYEFIDTTSYKQLYFKFKTSCTLYNYASYNISLSKLYNVYATIIM